MGAAASQDTSLLLLRLRAFGAAGLQRDSLQTAHREGLSAFLNDPRADASTPVRENPHYAGYLAIFGHGDCYGGPGHCELPPPRARPFDQRPRSHNTPRNHRLDITAAAHRMLQTGDELQITLLVIGVDYREERDLLRLEGVSLNLLD